MSPDQGPRIALLGISLEANRRSPVTDKRAFLDTLYLEAGDFDIKLRNDRASLTATTRGFADEMDRIGDWRPVPVLLAEAPPGGPIDHPFFMEMLDAMRRGLQSAGSLDGVYISEHGAGLTTQTDDPDGLVFKMARDVVGADVPIVATLDLHGHVTPNMVNATNALVAYRTNPHVDQEARGIEAAQLLTRMTQGLRTVATLVRVPMICPAVSLLTAQGPYADLIDFGQALCLPPVLNVSVLAGFAPANATTNGMSIVVTSDADAKDGTVAARRVAKEISDRAWSERDHYRADLTDLDVAVAMAKEVGERSDRTPIILADVADNPGAGGRGNTPYILRGLYEAGVQNAVVGMVIDAPLALAAKTAGIGARFQATFNSAETTEFSGSFQAEVVVEKIMEGDCVGRRGLFANRRIDLGICARLSLDGIQVIVATQRHQLADPVFIERMGIDIGEIKVLVVKSRGHFRAGFDEYFPPEQIIEVDAPGLTTPILARLGLDRVPRPIYPLDPDMSWQSPT